MSDFVLILSLLYCWLFDGTTLVLCRASEKDNKKIASSWFHGKLNFVEKSNFNHFYDSRWSMKDVIHHIDLAKI